MSPAARTEPTAQWKPDVEVPVYSLKDVAQHKQKNDMWIVVHGKVYDVSSYAQDHPGGAETIEEVAGMDATVAFEDIGHSEDARELLQPMLIGVLNEHEAQAGKPKKAVKVVSRAPASSPAKPSSNTGIYLSAVALAALVAIGARVAVTARTMSHPMFHRLRTSRLGGPNDFWNGVILTTAAFLVTGTYAFNRVSALFSVTSGFTRYPPHKKASSAAPTRQVAGFLVPNEYKTLPLVRKDTLSPNTVRLTFALPTPSTIIGLPTGQHISIRGPVGDKLVARSYTPTSNNADPGKLELVIKLYADGQLTGGYLANLAVGDAVAFRGPKGAMRYRRGWALALGMVAGGTGITPMYQLVRAICEDPADATQVSLVYANRAEEDILLREELDRFARLYPRNFRVWYMLDRPAEGWTGGSGFVTKEVMRERLPAPEGGAKMLLCGPPGMVKAAKVGLGELGWQVPGAVCKMSDQVFTF
ncbi:cytochrome b5 [Neofusicoccum parvum]|uniref:Cytochrome b5 n=1 Tax=Neofusicoccum parvum TaxID=310453 RepID=A0ACB5SCM9_9PEZI|nr:cytochrome b5 [Neofusicoccum parvum]